MKENLHDYINYLRLKISVMDPRLSELVIVELENVVAKLQLIIEIEEDR